MCYACADSETGMVDGVKVTACTIDRMEVSGRKTCPRDKFREGTGLTQSLGLTCYRVPMDTRLWIWLRHPAHPHPSSFRGCGCWKWARDLWERAASSSQVQ